MKLNIKLLLSLIFLFQIGQTENISAQIKQTKSKEELHQIQERLQQIQDELQELQTQRNNSLYTPKKQKSIEDVDISKIITEEDILIEEDTKVSVDSQNDREKRYSKIWTLEECIQHAIDNNISIQQLKIEQKVAKIQQSTAKNSRLPDLNAAVLQDWTLGRSQVYPDLNEPLSRSAAGVSSTIPIFTGFRIPNEVARTKLEFEAATQNLEKAKDNLSLNITSLFLQVLFNKELVRINEEQWALTRTQIRKTKILIEAGSVPPANLYDMQAQASKDKVAVIESRNNLELSLLDLAQSLELERETEFGITASVLDDNVLNEMFGSIKPAKLIYDNAVNFKPVIKEQEIRVESAKKALNIAKADYMPTLNFVFEYGTGYLYRYDGKDQINTATNELIRANSSFSTQLRNNDYTLVGLRLSIPIFNRFQTRNKVRTARLEIQNQQLILDNTKKTLYKEIQTAYKNAVAAFEKYNASNDAVKSTAESFKHAQVRYELAKLTPFEYDEAKTRFTQSQAEQIQAKYDYILRSKILDFYNGVPISL